jgi:hypothetical protein
VLRRFEGMLNIDVIYVFRVVMFYIYIVLDSHLFNIQVCSDHLCGLVVGVPGYRSRGLRFNSQGYQIF